MNTLEYKHDNFFKFIFGDPENVKDYLMFTLPESIKNEIDFDNIKIETSSHVSESLKGYFSDIIVKTKLKGHNNKSKATETDIYFLFEHKSYEDKKALMQLLKYMYLMWQKDSDENRPLRVILPLVFYHGKKRWQMPVEFKDHFNVKSGIKKHLLNFRYILFDTNNYTDFESYPVLKENIFLLTSLILMKNIFNNNLEVIEKIFDLWHKKGFIKNKKDKKLIVFLTYIMHNKDINQNDLVDMMDKNKIPGGETMPSLAQRLTEQGKVEGKLEAKLEDAKKMHEKGFSIGDILDITNLSREDLVKAGIIEDIS